MKRNCQGLNSGARNLVFQSNIGFLHAITATIVVGTTIFFGIPFKTLIERIDQITEFIRKLL
ncbi:MAG: hypothetical protein ACFFFH_05505 [Candidatus Thorarchaeota archaeon]